jgi:ribosomal protein L11 methyltransferase
MDGAVAAARANGIRNGVEVDWRVADLETEPIPMAELLLVNAPPPVHARAAAALAAAEDARLIVSGLVPDELGAAAREYAAAGWVVAARLEEDGWAAALLEPAGA